MSQIIVKFLGLLYRLYLTNKEGFGDIGNAIYSSGFQIYALLLMLSSVGVPNAISKLISEKESIGDEKNANRIFRISLGFFSLLGFLGSIILFLGARFISSNILQIPEAKLSIQVLAPSVFFVSIMSVLKGYFNAKRDMKPMAHSQSIEQVIKTILTIILVEYVSTKDFGNEKIMLMAAAASLATSMATAISYLYLCLIYKKNTKLKVLSKNIYKLEKISVITKKVIFVAFPVTLSVVLGGFCKNIDSFTVVRKLQNFIDIEEAKRQYGILSGKIETLITLPMSLNVAITSNTVPAISYANSMKNSADVKEKIRLSLLLTIVIALPCMVIMIVYAKQILQLLFPNASSGEVVYKISSISILFVMLNQTMSGIFQGLGKHTIPVVSMGIGVCMKLLLNSILLSYSPNKLFLAGITGASFSTVMCHVTAFMINSFYLNKILRLNKNSFLFVLKPVICCILMIIVSIFLYKKMIYIIATEKIAFVIVLFLSALFYFFELVLFKIFSMKVV